MSLSSFFFFFFFQTVREILDFISFYRGSRKICKNMKKRYISGLERKGKGKKALGFSPTCERGGMDLAWN